jgi:hypothetical protein
VPNREGQDEFIREVNFHPVDLPGFPMHCIIEGASPALLRRLG